MSGEAVLLVVSLLLAAAAWRELRLGMGTSGRTLAVGAAAVATLAALFAEVLEAVLDGQGLTPLDDRVLASVVDRRTSTWTAASLAVTQLGSTAGITVLVLVLGWVLWRRDARRTPFVVLALTGSLAGVTISTAKLAVRRDRPPPVDRLVEVGSYSFPSGHSLASMAVFLVAAWLVAGADASTRRQVVCFGVAVGAAVAVGATRIYLGVHWFTDVLASWALACLLALVVATATEYVVARRRTAAADRPDDVRPGQR